MPKYRLYYDVGFGREEEEIEAADGEAAEQAAYEAFFQACEAVYEWGFEELEAGESTEASAANEETDEDE